MCQPGARPSGMCMRGVLTLRRGDGAEPEGSGPACFHSPPEALDPNTDSRPVFWILHKEARLFFS